MTIHALRTSLVQRFQNATVLGYQPSRALAFAVTAIGALASACAAHYYKRNWVVTVASGAAVLAVGVICACAVRAFGKGNAHSQSGQKPEDATPPAPKPSSSSSSSSSSSAASQSGQKPEGATPPAPEPKPTPSPSPLSQPGQDLEDLIQKQEEDSTPPLDPASSSSTASQPEQTPEAPTPSTPEPKPKPSSLLPLSAAQPRLIMGRKPVEAPFTPQGTNFNPKALPSGHGLGAEDLTGSADFGFDPDLFVVTSSRDEN